MDASRSQIREWIFKFPSHHIFLGCLWPRNLLHIFLPKNWALCTYIIAPIKVPGVRFLGAGCGGTWPVASKHALGPHLRSPPQWLVEGGSLSLSLLVFPSFYLSLSLLEFEIYSAWNMYHGNVLILIRCLSLGQWHEANLMWRSWRSGGRWYLWWTEVDRGVPSGLGGWSGRRCDRVPIWLPAASGLGDQTRHGCAGCGDHPGETKKVDPKYFILFFD